MGLVPREYSSGEKQQRGHITKAGNSRMPQTESITNTAQQKMIRVREGWG